MVFREILGGGGGGWLAVVMAVNTVAGLYYYIAWVIRIFTPAAEGAETAGRAAGWMPASVAIAVAGIVAVAFSVAPQLVFDLIPGALIAAG